MKREMFHYYSIDSTLYYITNQSSYCFAFGCSTLAGSLRPANKLVKLVLDS